MAKQVKPKENKGESEEDLETLQTSDDSEEGLPWEEDFLAWNESERIDESTLTVTLYRLRPGKVKERVWRWTDEIPDEHDIGLQFGSGSYIVYATLSAPGGYRKVRHRRFILAASYDAERARAQREQGLDRHASPNPMGMGGGFGMGPEFVMGMMERMMTAFMGAMANRQMSAAPDMSHWNQANEIVGRVVSQAAESQLQQSREVTKLLAGAAKGESMEMEATDGDFKDYIKDMVKEYGPTLLEAAGLRLKAATGFVQKDDVFKSLASDPNLFGRVLNLLAKDPEVDKQLAEKVLHKLKNIGIAIPLPPGFSFKTSQINGSHGNQAG